MSLLDRKKLAVIHIVKRELNLSDHEYRNMMEQAAGVRSARDLDQEGFKRLMRSFARSKHYLVNRSGLTLRQKLYIEHLMRELDWGAAHLHNFLKKYYQQERIASLSKKEASKVIMALKNILSSQQQ